MKSREELSAAFDAAEYWVEGLGRVRIGVRDAAMDRWLRLQRAASATFVTAHNPLGRLCEQSENESAQQRLRTTLKKLRLRWVEGKASGPGWPTEPMCVVLDLDPRVAESLCEQFMQAATLELRLGRRPALRWFHQE